GWSAAFIARGLVRFGVDFVQAEDGIRDCHVTGVQTCALPIFGIVAAGDPDRAARLAAPSSLFMTLSMPDRGGCIPRLRLYAAPRSEERRVGKECRCASSTSRCQSTLTSMREHKWTR